MDNELLWHQSALTEARLAYLGAFSSGMHARLPSFLEELGLSEYHKRAANRLLVIHVEKPLSGIESSRDVRQLRSNINALLSVPLAHPVKFSYLACAAKSSRPVASFILFLELIVAAGAARC